MLKNKALMGSAGAIFAALVSGPAAAATLTGTAGMLTTSFTSSDNSGPGSDTTKSWLLGGAIAGPLNGLENLNFQAGASYTHNWAHQFSEEDWHFNANAFWAGNDGRVGTEVTYANFTGIGSLYSGGALGEWYINNLTAMAKAGWAWTTGSPIGGRGNYVGAALEFYAMPDLGITGGVEWGDIVSGQGCRTCGRRDLNVTAWEIAAEFLFSEDYAISGYAGFTYNQDKIFGSDTHDNIWHVGLRWYTGGGTLQSHHQNGSLNPWLSGVGALRSL